MSDHEELASLLRAIAAQLQTSSVTVGNPIQVSATNFGTGGSVVGMSISAVGGVGGGTVIGLQSSVVRMPDEEAKSLANEFMNSAVELEDGHAEPAEVLGLLGAAKRWVGKAIDAGTVAAAQQLVKLHLGS